MKTWRIHGQIEWEEREPPSDRVGETIDYIVSCLSGVISIDS